MYFPGQLIHAWTQLCWVAQQTKWNKCRSPFKCWVLKLLSLTKIKMLRWIHALRKVNVFSISLTLLMWPTIHPLGDSYSGLPRVSVPCIWLYGNIIGLRNFQGKFLENFLENSQPFKATFVGSSFLCSYNQKPYSLIINDTLWQCSQCPAMQAGFDFDYSAKWYWYKASAQWFKINNHFKFSDLRWCVSYMIVWLKKM